MSDQKRDPFKPAESQVTQLPEPCLTQAVCVGLYDTGTATDQVYKTKKRGVILVFELPLVEPFEFDGQKLPRTIPMSFNLSMGGPQKPSNLRKFIEAWRGKTMTPEEVASFTLSNVVGRVAQVTTIHATKKNGKTYLEIGAIMPAPKGTTVKATSPVVKFSVEQLDNVSELEQLDIPDWIKKRITDSDEYQKLKTGGQSQSDAPSDNDGGGVSDDVPW